MGRLRGDVPRYDSQDGRIQPLKSCASQFRPILDPLLFNARRGWENQCLHGAAMHNLH